MTMCISHTRLRLEAKIEELIALLDLVDDDPDLEDDGDREPEETDQNGDEADFSGTHEDGFGPAYGFDGTGNSKARKMLRDIRRRAEGAR
jgi:hypothetical protein